jgi:predicted transcriptional regulator
MIYPFEIFINVTDDRNVMTDIDLAYQMKELLNKDRLKYMEMIMNSDKGLGSLEIAQIICASRGITRDMEITRENSKINKRLRKLVNLGILMQIEEGKYSISSLGYLLMDSWKKLAEKADTVNKFSKFFNEHFVNDIPEEFFGQIYKIRGAKLTGNTVQWKESLARHMFKMDTKLYNSTQYLHDFPDVIIEKVRSHEIEIVIIYQFDSYPELNYSDEKELFDKLVEAGVEFRYIDLENRHPIGIRIIDDTWASFYLSRISDGKLDRDHVFIGTDREFITWCRDLHYHIWSFEAKPLNVEEVIAKKKRLIAF